MTAIIGVDQLRELADEYRSFRSLIIRHEQVLFAESQQSAACNSSHSVETRMCRWMLRMRDLVDSNDLTLTRTPSICARNSCATVEEYRTRAAKFLALARAETNRDLIAEWETLAECYVRLAEQADRNARTDVVYEPPLRSPGSAQA